MYLRPLEKRDLEQVLHWRNHPDIRQYMYNQGIISPDEHLQWFIHTELNPLKHCFIFEKEQEPCGYISIDQYSWGNIADWGFYIAPDAPKGTGMALGKTAIDYCFNTLKLDKLHGEVIDYNTRSIDYHKRLGFTEEGLRKNYYRNHHRCYDILFFGLQREQV